MSVQTWRLSGASYWPAPGARWDRERRRWCF